MNDTHEGFSPQHGSAKFPSGITANGLPLGQTQVAQNQQPQCDCHECTQARWKMFAGGVMAQMGRM